MNDGRSVHKVVFLGAAGVGKTTIIQKFLRSPSDFAQFRSGSTVMPACEEAPVTIDNSVVSMSIWDTAGQERFRAMTPQYMRGAHGVFWVMDLSDPGGFAELQDVMRQLDNEESRKCARVLIGNKLDLVPGWESVEVSQFCESNNLDFVTASAVTGFQISEAFQIMARKLRTVRAPDETGLDEFEEDENAERGWLCC
jgi:small GTP-binding protein